MFLGSAKVTVDCRKAPYSLIESGDFYAHALTAVRGSSRVRLLTSCPAGCSLSFSKGLWGVHTPKGIFRAPSVIDTRMKPWRTGGATPLLWQSFLGFEIQLDHPLFDPSTACLMDLEENSVHALEFLYLLPRTQKRALLEWTVFDPQPRTREDLMMPLKDAIARKLSGVPYRILRVEEGRIPMMFSGKQAAIPGVHDASLAGGSVRASSGYAYARIQQWADECAQSLARGDATSFLFRDPGWMRLMDRCFLDWLVRRPSVAPKRMFQLFRSTSPEHLIPFLSGSGGPRDGWAIARAVFPSLF